MEAVAMEPTETPQCPQTPWKMTRPGAGLDCGASYGYRRPRPPCPSGLPDSVHEAAGHEESPSLGNPTVPARTWGMCPGIGRCRRGTDLVWDLEEEGEEPRTIRLGKLWDLEGEGEVDHALTTRA